MRHVLIAAGGTGGHIAPGIALAEILEKTKKKYKIETVHLHVPERNHDYPDLQNITTPIIWHSTPQPGRNVLATLYLFPFNIIQSCLILHEKKIDTVIGMGGYSTIPAILYAILFRKKIYLCEQNTRVGKVNRILMRFAAKIAYSFPLAQGESYPVHYSITGNPLRQIITNAVTRISEKKTKIIHVLVMGGSQGARQINRMVVDLIQKNFQSSHIHFRIISGQNLFQEVSSVVGKKAEIIPFSATMGDHFKWANLVIARSGAGVLAEIAVFGLPSILIPYPYAADNHQKSNAEYFRNAGASWMIETTDDSSAPIADILHEIITNDHVLKQKSKAALKLGKKKAAEDTIEYFFS